MAIEVIKDYLFVLNLMMVIGVAIHSYIVSRSSANQKAIEAMNERIDDQEIRLGQLEVQLQTLPGVRADITYVHRRIDEVAKTTANIDGKMQQVNQSLALIQQHLIGNSS